MRNRHEYSVKYVSAFHNLFLSVWSLIMFVGMMIEVILKFADGLEEGTKNLYCDPKFTATGRLYYWMYIYYLSKYVEFFDTVIIILKKKQLIFLHVKSISHHFWFLNFNSWKVYHHCIVALMVWLWIDQKLIFASLGVCFNTFVHVIMYYFYYVSIMGQRVWWKVWHMSHQFYAWSQFHISRNTSRPFRSSNLPRPSCWHFHLCTSIWSWASELAKAGTDSCLAASATLRFWFCLSSFTLIRTTSRPKRKENGSWIGQSKRLRMLAIQFLKKPKSCNKSKRFWSRKKKINCICFSFYKIQQFSKPLVLKVWHYETSKQKGFNDGNSGNYKSEQLFKFNALRVPFFFPLGWRRISRTNSKNAASTLILFFAVVSKKGTEFPSLP